MQKIGLIGNGGQAREVKSYCHDLGIEVDFFAVEKQFFSNHESEIDIESPTEHQKESPALIALGMPYVKRKMSTLWPGPNYTTVIARNTYVSSSAKIERGCIIGPQASVGPDTHIGKHVLVNVGATIAHDCMIDEFTTVSPGVHIGGKVKIGKGCFIGIGAIIKDGVTLADGVVVGAGAVVLKDISVPNTLAVGVPAEEKKVYEDWLSET